MFQHLQHCGKNLETMTLYQLPEINTDASTVNLQALIVSTAFDDWKMLESRAVVQRCS